MLLLRNTKNETIIYLIVKDGGYSVGRKDCDIKIEGDQSISRKHALLTVQHPLNNVNHPDRLPSLQLKDSSKYGTLVNWKKMAQGGDVNLKPGDNVIFGALSSNSWSVEYDPLVVACSGLTGKEKQDLKKKVSQLGGHFVSEWTKECTLLVMREINVTAKVVGALVTCHPIVTPSFIDELLESTSAVRAALPDASRYLPPVVEKAINQDKALFELKTERKSMLRGKTFVFMSEKQHKRLHSVIELAGGKALLYSATEGDRTLLLDPQTCVLQSEIADNTQTPSSVSQEVERVLKRKQLRLIGEAELGLAVLTVSLSVYCNPSVPKEGVKLVSCTRDSQLVNLSTQKVLATDTEASEPSHALDTDRAGQSKEAKVGNKQPKFESPKDWPLPANSKKKTESTTRVGSLKSKSVVPETDESEDPFASEVPSVQRTTSKRQLSPDRVIPPTTEALDGMAANKRIKIEQPEEETDHGSSHSAVEIKREPPEIDETCQKDANHNIQVKVEPSEIVTSNVSAVVEEEEDSNCYAADSQNSQSQWRKNKRRRRLLSEDENGTGNAAGSDIASKEAVEGEASSLPSLPGFISKKHRCEVKDEVDLFEPALPKCLVVIESVSLIAPKPVGEPRRVNGSGHPVKNFKMFKKVSVYRELKSTSPAQVNVYITDQNTSMSNYAGQRVLPQIIGGSDLVVHNNMQSQASQDIFHADVQKSDIDKADALADELFSVEPRGRRTR